jgi:hypothetical protein
LYHQKEINIILKDLPFELKYKIAKMVTRGTSRSKRLNQMRKLLHNNSAFTEAIIDEGEYAYVIYHQIIETALRNQESSIGTQRPITDESLIDYVNTWPRAFNLFKRGSGLLNACVIRGKTELMRQLMESAEAIKLRLIEDEAEERIRYAFVKAATIGNLDAVKYLYPHILEAPLEEHLEYSKYSKGIFLKRSICEASKENQLPVVEWMVATDTYEFTLEEKEELLVSAARDDHVEILGYWLKQGIRGDIGDNAAFQTAINKGHHNSVRTLLQLGRETGIRADNPSLSGALSDATQGRYEQIIQVLREFDIVL